MILAFAFIIFFSARADTIADADKANIGAIRSRVTLDDLRSNRYQKQVDAAAVDPGVNAFIAVDPAGACGKPKLLVFERRGGVLIKTQVFEAQVGEKGRETPQGFFPNGQDFKLDRAYRRPVKTNDTLFNLIRFSQVHGLCSDRGIVDGRFKTGGLVILKDAESKIVYDLFAANQGKIKLLIESGSTAKILTKDDCDLTAGI